MARACWLSMLPTQCLLDAAQLDAKACVARCKHCGSPGVVGEGYMMAAPGSSLSRTRTPFSSYSWRLIQNLGLSFITSARTEPPMKTMSLRRGGSSIRILNFMSFSVSPRSTRSR
uniref:Putative secreted protein n=1 Tax=Amblyomma americanum TaxID=6943 RepID=A0A0C9SD83_AMBAM